VGAGGAVDAPAQLVDFGERQDAVMGEQMKTYKLTVLAKWPDAVWTVNLEAHDPINYHIVTCSQDGIIGRGWNADSAWADAARRIEHGN